MLSKTISGNMHPNEIAMLGLRHWISTFEIYNSHSHFNSQRNTVYIEGLITEFECVTVLYGIECVIITKKLHEIPYDMVTHWNQVINPYLHRQLTCSFSTFFPHERQ